MIGQVQSTTTAPAAGERTGGRAGYGPTLALLASLFFIWGFTTVINNTLLPHLRAVFDLLWYQGLPQAEAAALLSLAVPTVKLRWMKARLQVQQALGGSPFDDPGSPG